MNRYGAAGCQFVGEAAVFGLLVASIGLLWKNNLILFAVVLVEGAFVLTLWHDRYDLACFLLTAVFGSAAEVAFVSFGVWRYANPSLLGIPLWFPVAFGTAGLIGGRLVRSIATLWERP
jgi:uncharacterized membrane protein YoaT (DUF817 family)